MSNTDNLKESVADVGQDAKAVAAEGLENVKDVAIDLKDKAADGLETAKAVGSGLLGALKDKATEVAEKVTNRDLDGDGKVG